MSARLIKVAAFYLVAGVTMGIVAGHHARVRACAGARTHQPARLGDARHRGVIYHAYPAAGETRLATVHFWIHNTALPVFMVGLGFALTGHEAFLPWRSPARWVSRSGIVVFKINIWRTVAPVSRTPALGVPAARAAT
jgi:hypothetical protein